jgi:hypothetical protein
LVDLLATLKKDMKNYISTSKKVYGKMMKSDKKEASDSIHPPKNTKEQVKSSESALKTPQSQPEKSQVKQTQDEVRPIEEPKVVELEDDFSDCSSTHEMQQNQPKSTNRNLSHEELVDKVDRLEGVIEELKYSMDILKGYGAIPLRMPDEEERKDIEKRQKEIEKNSKPLQGLKRTSDNMATDD